MIYRLQNSEIRLSHPKHLQFDTEIMIVSCAEIEMLLNLLYGSHIGSQLGFLKILKVARVTSFRFLLPMPQSFQK